MITVDDARALLRERARPIKEAEEVALIAARGRVLARAIRADRHDPPFDRAMMDGYAVRAAETTTIPRRFEVIGRIGAGATELPYISAGHAAWINTGAPLPPGADAVVPVEQTREEVSVLATVEPGANVLPKGCLAQQGDVVAHGILTPERIAICASVGAETVSVRRRPRVAILATGSELATTPGAHEIRNSNGPMLQTLLADYDRVDLGVAADDLKNLDMAIRKGLESADVLVTTGGVSQGELDLVRPRLEANGVEIVFHKVQLQPGKPVLFGAHAGGVVFGLPGNPVSALVCADLFLLPFLAVRAGRDFDEVLIEKTARLTAPVKSSPKRRRVFPCSLHGDTVDPLPWRSSADLYTVANSNAYMVVELGHHLAAGAQVTCLVPERFGARSLA